MLKNVMATFTGLLLVAGTIDAAAQSYPMRPIRIVVPQSPGGSTDLTARLVARGLSEALGQPVVVDNRPGGGSILGTDLVAKAAPDGHTLLVVASSITIHPSLHANLPFDPQRDFAPITQLSTFPNLLAAHPSVPVKTVQDVIALAKAKPGQLNYGSSGTGTGTHLSAELFKNMTGVNIVHVPYKGGGPANTAVIGGQVQLVFGTTVSLLPHARAGRLRAIAVTTARRSPAAPEIPTIAESGVAGYDHGPWNGMFAPVKVSKAVVTRLNAEIVKIVHGPEVRTVLANEGAEPVGSTPEVFAGVLKTEIAKWAKVVKAAGIKAD